MNQSRRVAFGAILATAAGGVGVWTFQQRRKPAAKPLASIRTVPQATEVTLTGRLQAQKTAQVDAPISGVLDAWFVEEGQEVYEDQLVGRIRNAELDKAAQEAQSALDRAEIRMSQIDAQTVNARLEVSRTSAERIRARNDLDRIEGIYQRYKSLMDAGALARLTFEKTEADYIAAKAEAEKREVSAKEAEDKMAALQRDAAEAKRLFTEQTAALAKAKDAVAEGDLRAPADGVVLTRGVHQGDQVQEPAEGLLTVAAELTKLRVSLTPDPAVVVRIHAGQHAFVHTDDGTADGEFPGAVREVRGGDVIIEFTSRKPITKLGGAVQVRIVF